MKHINWMMTAGFVVVEAVAATTTGAAAVAAWTDHAFLTAMLCGGCATVLSVIVIGCLVNIVDVEATDK